MTLDEYRKKYKNAKPVEKQQEQKGTKKVGALDRYRQKYGSSSGSNAQTLLSSFDQEFRDFATSAQESSKNMGYSTYDTAWKTHNPTAEKLQSRVSDLKLHFASNKSTMDEAMYNKAMDYLENAGNYLTRMANYFSQNRQHYSQWDSEDAYNEAVKQWQEYYDKWGHYADADDFQEKSAYVSNVKYGPFGKPEFTDDTYAYINNPTVEDKRLGGGQITARSLIEGEHDIYAWDSPIRNSSKSSEEGRSLNQLDNDEIALYNYIYATEGKDSAEEYLSYIQKTLNYRAGSEISKTIQEIDIPVVEYLAKLNFGVEAGIDQFGSGVAQLFSEEELAPTATQYASAQISESLDGLGKYAYSAATSVGNMAPSILASAVLSAMGVPMAGEIVGAGMMGASSAGNAYTSALHDGYSKEQARNYGVLVGASEAALQYILGGIGKLGGVSSSKILSKVAAIDKSFLRILAKLGVEIGSEITEEELQNFLEPAFRSIIFGEEYDAPTIDELLETAIVTALSTGALEGPGTIGNDVANSRYYTNTYGNVQRDLVEQSLELPDGSLSKDLGQKYQQRLDAGKDLNGHQLGRLVEANEQFFRTEDISKIQSAAEARLTELGETGDVGAIAAALAKRFSNQKLTRKESQLIANSQYGRRVSTEMNPENIQTGDYSSEWAEKIDTNRINVEEYSRLVEAAQLPQETVETSGGQIVPETQNVAQQTQVESEMATVRENRTIANLANDQQMTGKLTGKDTLQVDEKPTVTEEAETKTVTLEDASKKYGAQAQAMISTYTAGQDVAKYDAAYQMAYDMGRSGVSLSYAMNSEATQYLSDEQKKNAYNTGKDAADSEARAKDAVNKAAANGKTGWKKGGVVRGEGVTIADLKKAFNDHRGKAYKSLSTIAKVTGINIVLYKSKTDADGNFIDAHGEFHLKNPNEIRIDINAGLENISDVAELEKYVLLRTFSHEFTHFVEKWNPIQYNEFRMVVFDTMTQRGEDVNRLIELQQEKNPGMGYEAASREVVAEAMTDILPDSSFVQTLAEKHQNIFKKLLEKLKEFARNLREYFDSIGYNDDAGANALKENVDGAIKYVDSIVKLFDNVAVQAVENSQKTVAVDEVVVAKNETTSNENPNKATTVSETESVLEHRTTEEQPAEVISKTETTTSEHGFTITDNAQYGSLEITFDGKPPVQVRDALKENKFRWNGKKGVWYGKADRSAITEALNEAFEADNTTAENTAMQPLRDMDAKPVGEYGRDVTDQFFPELKGKSVSETPETTKDQYDEISDALQTANVFWKGEYEFRVDLVPGAGYNGKIKRYSDGYASNTRDVIFSSMFATRQEAVADLAGVARNNKLLGEKAAETPKPKKEVTDNGENADNQGAVPAAKPDGRGAARLLDEVEAGDVSGDGGSGDAVADAGERGQSTVRDGGEPDHGAGDVGGHGEGSGQSGDLRGTDRVTESATDNSVGDKTTPTAKDTEVPSKETERLHEEVVEQIAQQSTEQPKGRNFVIGDSLDLPSGEKARYKANVEAIRLVKQLEAEGRYATEAEQTILSKYVGWGGLANAFDQRKAEWAKEFAELKELLTEEEYASARGSTLNAHYTDISVIKAMYDGLKQLGFTGGRMMEPSSGVGNFVGAMPADMSSKVRSWTMVELDGITGLIGKYLYPNADMRIQGFEKANIPNNFMDVAIGNVPFGNYAIADKHYPKKVTSAIHNYFFAKSLDKVRPGGIVMFITSSYTMNSSDSTVRRYIMQKADLLGAIRLPDTAFKGNAGTEVVTDILVLKKRADNTNYAGEDFLEAPYTRPIAGNWSGAYINDYFNNHPEMVLGTPSFTGGMYRSDNLTYKALEGKGSLADQIRGAFRNIHGKMDYPAQKSPEKTNFAVERASKKTKENGLVVKEGKVYKNTGGELIEQKVAKGVAERISGMLEIRDAAKALQAYQQQGLKDTEIKKARQKLNKVYDDFVKKYGFINAKTNRRAIKDDPDSFSILALENWNPDAKKATKADIFSKNTIAPNRTVTSAKDVAEGLIVSVNQTGGVDAALIARLTGNTVDDVTRELIDSRAVFKNRDGVLETAEVYLSGNVRAKLRDAEAMVPMDADYQKNVEALKAVMPEDVGYQDIFVNPGTPWIPDSVYSDFAAYMLGTVNRDWRKAVEVTRNADTGNFTVELKEKYLRSNSYNTQKWGTSRRSFLGLFDAMLNSKSVVVKYKTDDGKSVVDQDATAAANEKVENIKKEFQEWLWKDESRRGELATLYNETFNSIVTPKYNGDNLTVNGANAMKPLRPHQRNAVQRIISSGGNTLLAHKVGAGKTYEMAAAAMKLKQLGLVKKPMFAVPKSLVAQWGNEFMDFFPTAKLLVAEVGDFTAANRKVFVNRIANGDYDAVIVSYEQFERLPMSADFTRELYQEQIDSVIRAIEEAKAEKGDKSLSVKDLEKKRKQLQTKIDKLTDTAKDEDNIDFEQLGVDSIFVDEAHNFKNLFYTTSMTNVSGLGNKDGSKIAFDLYTKVRYLQKLNGGRGIVFATATPVMNSMSEMYIMQKYLQPDLLDQLGLSTFDAWAKQFGEVVNGVEIKPSGQGYRVKQSFSRFKNMSELQLLFRNFADVRTDIPGLKIPKMKGGKVNVVVCEPGQFQQDYMKELEKRADNIKNVDPSVDNMLKITSDGRKISYTQRMIDPTLPYEEGCKIYRCADNVLVKYQESSEIKGTQIIFCDMATPKGKSSANTTETEEIETDMESAKLYDDIKARLIKGGIPSKEIAFIHEADTDAKKKKLFADVNDGKVRVLIGSTGKMGVGMNAQKRIVAIHHLDAPWRPGDVEQRNGRAYRQGNINDEVENFTYVTEGSFDARLWDILERKQNFINQVMNGENVGRETEDTGEVTLSAAEVKALASGSPLIMEQVQLDTDIKKLESLYRSHRSAVANARGRLETDKGNIATYEKFVANGKKDLSARVDTYSEGKFSITIGRQKFTDKKDAGAQLMAEATAKANEEGYTTIGKFAGFDLRVIKTHEGIKGQISGSQAYSFNTYPANTTYMINHLIAKVEAIDDAVKLWEHKISEAKQDMAEQEKLINQPFAKQAELEQKRARYNEVMEILNPKEEQALDNMDEDAVQYQRRKNQLTNWEVLALAERELQTADLPAAERDALGILQQRLSKLETLQAERKKLGKQYIEQQFGTKVDRAAAEQTRNRMKILDGQIEKAKADVLSIEDKHVLNQVLQKARKVVEKQQWIKDEEKLKRWRDRRNNADAVKKYRERLRKDVNDLTNWVLHPNNKDVVKHIPDALKNSVLPFLSSIDFTSKQALRGGNATKADQEFMKRLNGLKAALKPQQALGDMYEGYTDLPPNFMDRLQTFIDAAQAIVNANSGEFVVNQMTSNELRELSQVVRTLKEYIQNFNKFHYNAMYQHVNEAGDNTIGALGQMDNAGPHTGGISNFVFWQQMRPAYAWERFGEGGKAIYDGLRRGQAKLAFNTKVIVDFSENAYTEAEVKAWEKQINEIELGGDIVKMPVSAIMSFYELSKRPHALGHIIGQGVRVATYKSGGKKISDIGHAVTMEDVQTIIGTLTDRQKEVADSLQKFMQEQGGKWGNYVSMKRFGEELFGEDHYFPINSDGRHLSANADEHPSAASLYALLNMGFTKSTTEGANNRLVLYSIFDVFANHMASMAQYNALALPVVDALKWFNYQQKSDPDENGQRFILGSVRDQMDRVYGVPEETRPGSGRQGYAQTFVINILKAFNGTEAQGIPTDSIGIDALHRYNVAQVAYNFRVVVQQPLAITRAALLIDYGSIIKGMKLSPAAIRQNIREMQSYSGIAAWKSLGFYDVNISRGLTDIIKHDTSTIDKITNVGMWGAEKADLLTWAGIWSACKEEVIKKQRLTPKSDGFYDAVTKLFEEVIYKTQVVDSVLTKNEYLRSKGLLARLTGSFMSEPTTTASMLINAYDKYHADMQRGMTRQQAWKKNGRIIGRTAYVYALSAAILAAVQAVADAFRDDDDYETFLEKWLEAFGGNLVDELMPFNKLPILSDFYDLAKELIAILGVDTYGNPPQSVFMQWYDSLVKGAKILYDKISGEDTNYTWYGGIYKLLQAVSGGTGLPMAAVTREIIAAWNNIVGAMAPSLKVKTYDSGEKNEIKYAYQDGYLTAEEAAAELLKQGLVDNEDEAYWTVQGWEAGEGYSRYDAIYDVVRNGGDFKAAMDELISHGYEKDDVLSQVKGQIGDWYKNGEITKQQATDMLTKYSGLDSEDITSAVNKWSSKVVTGIAFEDIKDEYLAGNITASRAIEMYVRYGGYAQDKATETVTKWGAEKDIGIAYDDIKDAFMNGDISVGDAKNMYITYGGLTNEKANEKVTVLAFVKKYPETDGISYSGVEAYQTYCKSRGVPAATFYDAWKYKSSAHADVDANGETISGSKKVKVLAYINSLNLTYAQKDSLYYAFGWAQSTIYEAPWH